MAATARGTASDIGDSPLVTTGARLGYAAGGLLHLVIGWLAVSLAWGGSGSSADQSGALSEVGSTPLGSSLVWVVVVGFALLAVWQATAIVTATKAKDRLTHVAKAVTYVVLAGLAAAIATGSSSGGGSGETKSMTATVMAQPLGQLAVGVLGAVIIGVGIFHVVKGWRRTFLEDLRQNPGRWVVLAGRVGYVAKGIALGVVGALFAIAAATNDPEEAEGLDGALRTLLELPLGKALLTAVGIGLAAYGVYSFGRARYAKV